MFQLLYAPNHLATLRRKQSHRLRRVTCGGGPKLLCKVTKQSRTNALRGWRCVLCLVTLHGCVLSSTERLVDPEVGVRGDSRVHGGNLRELASLSCSSKHHAVYMGKGGLDMINNLCSQVDTEPLHGQLPLTLALTLTLTLPSTLNPNFCSQVDTNHFKGNFPESCLVQTCTSIVLFVILWSRFGSLVSDCFTPIYPFC